MVQKLNGLKEGTEGPEWLAAHRPIWISFDHFSVVNCTEFKAPHVPRVSAFGVEDLSTNLQWLGWALGIPASCVEFKNDQK